MKVQERISFLKNFINDVNVASLTPSSQFSVKRLCRKMDWSKPKVVVEYGPGSGVFSRYILQHLHPDSKLILIETNDEFVAELKAIGDSRVEVHQESAENVVQVLRESGEECADYVISGIPFSYLNKEQKNKILGDTYRILKPGGKFLTYQFLFAVRKLLRREFDEVNDDFELLNMPPLFMFEAIKHNAA